MLNSIQDTFPFVNGIVVQETPDHEDMEQISAHSPEVISFYLNQEVINLETLGSFDIEMVVVDDSEDVSNSDTSNSDGIGESEGFLPALDSRPSNSADVEDSEDVPTFDTSLSYSAGISGRRRRFRHASRHRRCLRKSCYRCRRPCPKNHAQQPISPECGQILTDMVMGLTSVWRLQNEHSYDQPSTVFQDLCSAQG